MSYLGRSREAQLPREGICGIVISVWLVRVSSSCSLSVMTSSALSTGTLVKSAVTSYDTSFRAGGISRPLNLSTSSLVFLTL